jgi:type IV pilus assembly protein PilW
MLKTQRGITLIELMVGMVLGLLVTGIAIQMYISTLGITKQTTETIRLNQELRAVADLIVTDLRRAGYWSGASAGTTNPYSELVSDGSGGGAHVGVFNSGTCVVLAYENSTASPNEHIYGYRVSGAVVQMLTVTSYASGSYADCGTPVGTGSWDDLTDSRAVQIESLTFTLDPATSWAEASSKSIQVDLVGTATRDGNLRRAISEQVRIRNEY